MQTRVKVVLDCGRVRLYSDQYHMFIQGPKDPGFRISLSNKVVRVERVDPFNRASFLKLV